MIKNKNSKSGAQSRISGLLKILVIGYDPCYLSSGKRIKYILCRFGPFVLTLGLRKVLRLNKEVG